MIGAILVLSLLYNFYSLNSSFNPIKEKSEGLIDELASYRDQQASFASDLNEIRQYLLLPTKDYSTGEVKKPDNEQLKSAVLTFVGAVGQNSYKEDKVQDLHEKIQVVLADEDFQIMLKEQNLTTHTFYPQYDGESVYTFLGIKSQADGALAFVKGNIIDGSFLLDASVKQYQLGKKPLKSLMRNIEKNKEKWVGAKQDLLAKKAAMLELVSDEDFSAVLDEHKLKFDADSPQEKDTKLIYAVNGPYGLALNIGILKEELKFFVDDFNKLETFDDLAAMKIAIKAKALSLDLRSPLVKTVDSKKQMLEDTFRDKSFDYFLKEFEGIIADDPIEEDDRYVYELRRAEELIGSVILEKGTGLVKVLRAGEEIAVNIFDFQPISKKKI